MRFQSQEGVQNTYQPVLTWTPLREPLEPTSPAMYYARLHCLPYCFTPFGSPEMKSGKGGKLSLPSGLQTADSYKN